MAAAARIIGALGGDKAQRVTAYEQLASLAQGDKTEEATAVATACVGPLMDVLRRDVAEVDGPEYDRAVSLLRDLSALNNLSVGAEYVRDSRLAILFSATSGSAFAAVFDVEPSELTRKHAMRVGLAITPLACTMARGASSHAHETPGSFVLLAPRATAEHRPLHRLTSDCCD